MKIIDPHLHLFDLAKGDYHWLKVPNPPFWPDKKQIARDFNFTDLTLDNGLELAGFVHIEAGFDNQAPTREIAWLEQLDIGCAFKTIAGFDLTASPAHNQQLLAQLQHYASFIGVRHIFDDDPEQIINQPNCRENFALLDQQQVIFETQLTLASQQKLAPLSKLIHSNPNIKFVVNHAGFAPLASDTSSWELWRENLRQLANYKNCAIKCSGWEMVNRQYQIDQIEQVVTNVLHLFGDERVMLASNFPLTLFSRSYQSLWQAYAKLKLKPATLNKLIKDNAQRVYQLGT